MEDILVWEKKTVHIRDYPYAEKLNPVLNQIIKEKAVKKDKGALMTSYASLNVKEFKLISDYVIHFLSSDRFTLHNPHLTGLDGYPLRMHNLWGQLYNKGHFQNSHHHLPYDWSFVYYVNTPRRSSPIVFDESRKRIRLKAGQVIIFPSWLLHHVPPNKCEGRVVIGGNLSYTTHQGIK